MGFSFTPIVLESMSTGPIGPGRPADPMVQEIGETVVEIFTNLRPGTTWSNEEGKIFGLPIPDSILKRPIQHRDGTEEINPKANAQNFATKIKQFVQRAVKEDIRENILVSVRPHITANGPIYTLSIVRFAGK